MSLFPDSPQLSLPRPFQNEEAQLGFERWEERLQALGDAARPLQETTAAEGPRRLLAGIFSHSPFLTDCLLKEAELFGRLVEEGPDPIFAEIQAAMRERPEAEERTAVMRRLRRIRRQAAMTIALADLTQRWDLDRVTGALSDLAIGLLGAAFEFLLLDAARRKQVELADPARPSRACGFVALGMGKLGARELNFSSDIDLIVIYDPKRFPSTARQGPDALAQRMTRDLVAILSERTADGYCFRVDLRLRPDPGATPLAVPLNAALAYYESMGQNWERAAMIKARPVMGELELGRAFLKEIRPFIWRRSLDFLAIQDIHAIKHQIYAAKGGSVVAIEGHNIKLGRGGIREIEFYAQTQQLIWGGREPALRCNRTIEALHALAGAGLIPRKVAEDLEKSYGFLRQVEHRLQMVADQQTHSLPEDKEGVARLAAFLGYPGSALFRSDLLLHLHRVEDYYARLFEEDIETKSVPAEKFNLVFTGDTPGPDTVATLSDFGFEDPERVFSIVRSWHHGRYRATRSTATRERLTLLMPRLLKALASSADPDAALTGFDTFLAGLPAGMHLFTLLTSNPQLMDLLAAVMGTSPALAKHLARRPSLIDTMLSPDFFETLPKRETLQAEFEEQLDSARSFEEELDLLRRSVHDRNFQAGVQMLLGLASEETLARRLSDIADAALAVILARVEVEFARRYGRIAQGSFAIVELGKLGSREMTFTSDLDLVFVYEVPEGTLGSDGEKSLDPTTYFARFSQRIVNAITAPTAEGTLYAIDMRLRPAGNAGPIATSLAGFERYHREEAWAWEHMALTRARVISTDPAFRDKVYRSVEACIRQPRDPGKLLDEVASMRRRLARDKPPQGPWDLKMRPGGLIDCEFLAQYWQLAFSAEHPEILRGSTYEVFMAIGEAGLVDRDQAEELAGCVRFLRRLQAYIRLTLGDDRAAADLASAPQAIKQGMVKVCDALDFGWLRDTLEEVTTVASGCMERYILEPAQAAEADKDSLEEERG